MVKTLFIQSPESYIEEFTYRKIQRGGGHAPQTVKQH